MKTYTIAEMAKLLNISKQTLRYYDSLHLVSPMREENNYRYYTTQDRDDLTLILLLKYGGFSLESIASILKNRRNIDFPKASLQNSKELLKDQRKNLQQKIENLTDLLRLMDHFLATIENEEDCIEINHFIQKIYQNILQETRSQ